MLKLVVDIMFTKKNNRQKNIVQVEHLDLMNEILTNQIDYVDKNNLLNLCLQDGLLQTQSG